MKKYMVSFDVGTAEASLNELEAILGPSASSMSHDKGDKNGAGKVWKQTRWSIESQAEEAASLEDHLGSLLNKIPFEKLREEVFPADCSRTLNIGVLYDTYTCSVLLPPEIFARLGEYNVELEITCYPTDFLEE